MIKFAMRNLQAIKEATITIEENSITEFTGDNSNGKSVLTKVLRYLISGDIKYDEIRNPLIRDHEDEGILFITSGTNQLGILLRRKIADCFLLYNNEGGNPSANVVRGLGDRAGCEALLHAFGFRSYQSGEICLQFAPTYGPIPFITTTGKTNAEIADDITTDKVAEEFLKSFNTITFPVFRDMTKNLKKERDSIQTILANLESYDWRAYEAMADKLKLYYNTIKGFSPFTIKDIPVPYLDVIPVSEFFIPDLPHPHFLDYAPSIPIIERELNDYLDIVNGICPTCGKSIF